MRKLFSALCAGALALTMVAPAGAQGMGQDQMISQGLARPTDRGFRMVRDGHRRHWSGHHHRGFYSNGGYYWYNGHRGYRHYRHGYREYNGWWFPATAFLGAAIIGNAIANAPRGGNAHVQWCYDHYRSYRASDNTYQPYGGPRRQCVSPY